MSGIPPNIRSELIANAERGKRRSSAFSRERPTDWRPTTVVDPRDSEQRCFTDMTAWDFIVEMLQSGCEVEEIVLDKPQGKIGYVLKIAAHPHIYIKLQLGPPGVVGRSFHCSEYCY
jgi:hypothetical protein